MSTNHINYDQEIEDIWGSNRSSKAIVWEFFEKIVGDDGLPRTRCKNCGLVYNLNPKSGTSTMRRHLPKCFPTQISPLMMVPSSNDEPVTVVRATKKPRSVMEDNVEMKPDRELYEFIWRYKRNIPLLEQKIPDKALVLKATLKCYEDELERRANLRIHKETGTNCGTSIVAIKTEMDYLPAAGNEKFDEDTPEDESAAEDEITETPQLEMSPQFGTEKVVVKVEMDDQFVVTNETFGKNIAVEENREKLQIVATHKGKNQPPGNNPTISKSTEDIYDQLRKVSSMLSMVTSSHNLYTPNNPLDEEAEQAKQILHQLLKKDFESIVGSPDEEHIKSSIQILMKNLDKIPMIQGKVIEGLNVEFDSSCINWRNWAESVRVNIVFEVQQAENIRVLEQWHEKDRGLESKIAELDEDIVRLKAELCEKELTRERLVEEKLVVFDESKFSIEESKQLLHEMVSVKLQSDVALDNMRELAAKWERMRENFQ